MVVDVCAAPLPSDCHDTSTDLFVKLELTVTQMPMDTSSSGSGMRRARSNKDDESERLIEAARQILLRKTGSGFTLNEVLEQSGLGTRAFYRHFGSKDELALAVFAGEAEREARRLHNRMKHASDPIEGVVAWIDVRLEPGFDQRLAASQRPLTEEAVRASRRFPRQLEPAFNRTLEPLIEQLTRGLATGDFAAIDPVADAKAIHHVVSGVVEQRWSGFPLPPRETRAKVLRFCLCALGVDASRVTEFVPVTSSSDTPLSA
jgi:AcrR family transcriptional regulator